MGTPEDLSRCQGAGLSYGDHASAALERDLGRQADLQELATFYAAAIGGMQGAFAALLHRVAGIDDTREWFTHINRITQAISQGKKAQISIEQITTVTELDGAAAPVPPLASGNGHAVPDAPALAPPPAEPLPCSCLNRSGMCVVCLEGLVARLTKAAGWISQAQGLSGALDADCPACTPRILDRAVATAIKKNIAQIQPEHRGKILSAVISALPQLTGLEEWPETYHIAEQLCPELVSPSE